MEIRKGIIKSYDSVNHQVDVQIIGSMATLIKGVPVAHHLGSDLLAPGTLCAILFLAGDAGVVLCTWDGAPPPWITGALIKDGEVDTPDLADGAVTSAKIADGTVAVGDLAFDPATQSELDAHTGQEPFEGHSGNPQCHVYHNVDQAIATGTWTALSFNSERFDTDGMHDTVTNNSRLTIQTQGKYVVGCRVEWDAATAYHKSARIVKNGSTYSEKDYRYAYICHLLCVTFLDLAVSDYLQVEVWHNASGSRNVLHQADYAPAFWAVRVG